MADRKPLNQKHVPGLNLKFKLLLNMSFSTPYELEKIKNEYNQKVKEINNFFKKKYGKKKLKKIDISKMIKRDFFKDLFHSNKNEETLEEFLKNNPEKRDEYKEEMFFKKLIDDTGLSKSEFKKWKKEELDNIENEICERLKEIKKIEKEYGNEIEKFKEEQKNKKRRKNE